MTRAGMLAAFAVGSMIADTAHSQSAEIETSYSLQPTKLSLHEPVRVIFELKNHSAQAIRVDLGRHRTDNFVQVLTRPDGRREQLPGTLPAEGAFRIGKVEVEPGGGLRQVLLLNERTSLSEPGRYALHVELRSPVATPEGAKLVDGPSGDFRFEIGPRNEARLIAVCERLLDEIVSTQNVGDIADAALALAHVQDPVAIPYIEKALRSGQSAGQSLAAGLVQMGDARAAQALIAVFNDVYDPSLPRDSWQRTRATAIWQALASMQAQTSDQEVKDQIARVLEQAVGPF